MVLIVSKSTAAEPPSRRDAEDGWSVSSSFLFGPFAASNVDLTFKLACLCLPLCLCDLATLWLARECPTEGTPLQSPGDKEEAIFIGILHGDEAAAPPFFNRRLHFNIPRAKVFVVFVDVGNA